jgi:hypothetical protein
MDLNISAMTYKAVLKNIAGLLGKCKYLMYHRALEPQLKEYLGYNSPTWLGVN